MAEVTWKDVVRAVGWLDSTDDIEFNAVDWSCENAVRLEGRRRSNGDLVDATFRLVEWTVGPDWDEFDTADDDDEDEEESDA